MIQANSTRKRTLPKLQYVSQIGWGKGRYSRLDADRIPQEGLAVTENVMLDQDGTVTPRPGLKLYGTQPTGTVLGQVYEYVRMNGTTAETWNIWMENRSGTGYVITSKDGGAHTVVTGKTYSVTADAHFEQIFGKVMIMNGVDNLSYMDVQTQTITAFTALTQPSVAPTPTATGISGSTLTLRYKYTATSSVGETAASPVGTVGVTAVRSSWDGTTQYVTLVGNRITNAVRYNIYVGDQSGFEYFLDSIPDPGTGTTWTYKDIGAEENVNRVASASDSTIGPKVTRAWNIKGQLYMTGDTDNPYRIWFGGTGDSALDFSAFNNGGWVEPNKGGKDFPVTVKPFRDGKGTSMAACLTKGTNGLGKRLLLQQQSVTAGDTTLTYMSVAEDNGQDGTDSPDAVVLINDSLIYPSRDAFKSSSTLPQIQNLISTKGISDNISTSVNDLSSFYMKDAVAYSYDQQVRFALPFQSTSNSQIWNLDLRQSGAWMTPWYVSADWLWLYSDNTTGKTKQMALVSNGFYEFDTATATNDNGTAFLTNVGSGTLKFSEDGGLWGSVIDVTFVFLRPQGNINLSVAVQGEDETISFSETFNATAEQSVGSYGMYGWGAAGWGSLPYGSGSIAVETGLTRETYTIPIDEECDGLSWGVSTSEAGVSYQLAEVIIQYVPIGYRTRDN